MFWDAGSARLNASGAGAGLALGPSHSQHAVINQVRPATVALLMAAVGTRVSHYLFSGYVPRALITLLEGCHFLITLWSHSGSAGLATVEDLEQVMFRTWWIADFPKEPICLTHMKQWITLAEVLMTSCFQFFKTFVSSDYFEVILMPRSVVNCTVII